MRCPDDNSSNSNSSSNSNNHTSNTNNQQPHQQQPTTSCSRLSIEIPVKLSGKYLTALTVANVASVFLTNKTRLAAKEARSEKVEEEVDKVIFESGQENW